jgi:hypothetical protein
MVQPPMTKPVHHRSRRNADAACIQARRFAAAFALFVAAGCVQEPPAPHDAETGCAVFDFLFRKPAFHLDVKGHINLRSTPIHVVVSRKARPLSEPIQHPAALAPVGGASPPETDAPAAKPPEAQRSEAPAVWPWFFTLVDRLDCAWPVDFDPHETATLMVRLHVRVRRDGHVESTELISAHGNPAHLLAAFHAGVLAAIQRASPLLKPNELVDRIIDEGLDATFEVRGFERGLRAAIELRQGRGSVPRRLASHRAS